MPDYPKKLIEVALPLEAINKAAAREKSIRHGHPSTLHLWWARRPLAAARAVIFAQMVDDPSAHPDEFPAGEDQERERRRLFRIIEELVQWESTTDEAVLSRAREEIRKSWRRTCAANRDHPRAQELFNPETLPAFHDPFAGGGALPLEAQRLGLESHASDLNPVAVLINKAMIEIPPKFAGRPPVNPEARRNKALLQEEWKGARGLAEDVRYYGQWMRDEAEKRIGHLYPQAEVTAAMAKDRPDLKPYVGKKLTVIAWLWARTVKCPNPACGAQMPLISSFALSTKSGRETWFEPVIDQRTRTVRYAVKSGKGKPPDPPKIGRGAKFKCIVCGEAVEDTHIKEEGIGKRMGAQLTAIVAEGDRSRVYLPASPEHEAAAACELPEDIPSQELPADDTANFWCTLYGLKRFSDLFTPRQLVALTTFSDLVGEAMARVKQDAVAAGLPDDGKGLAGGGTGAQAYADAVGVYLGFGVDRLADRSSTICAWDTGFSKIRNTFGRQALPMTWDYAEGNPFSVSTGNFSSLLGWVEKFLATSPAMPRAFAVQQDASSQVISTYKLVSTDPPYYDNIGYADLSDFFYVWLRSALKPVFPTLFSTLAVPKAEELVATPHRHGSKEKAESFFLDGMTQAMHRIAGQAHPAFPVTIYYAFKQAESDSLDGTASTGWETFLDAAMRAGFAVGGTWPVRTELSNRMIGSGTNALASSIVLVCRKRDENAPLATRREFLAALQRELPGAIRTLQHGAIAPVDLQQAAIGPGMAVFTRYSRVVEADGSPMTVRTALGLINQVLDEALSEQDAEYDPDTRWALSWFEQFGFGEGPYGDAETLSKAKNTSVSGLVEAGVIASKAGKVRLLRMKEMAADWDPAADGRLTVWEAAHHLIRTLEDRGEDQTARLLQKLGGVAETSRDLAYRLYTLCERKKWAREALSYNGLVVAWPVLSELAGRLGTAQTKPVQEQLI